MTSEKEEISIASPSLLEFDSGSYNGTTNSQGIPHGQGRLDFKENDPMDRRYYEGQWVEGQINGKGKMVFLSQDIYEGGFSDGMPHGHGEFTYANGNVESAEWENGNRHGLSRFISTNGNSVEEAMFWEGVPDGPATFTSVCGTVEEFTYNQGRREGSAVRKLGNGDTLRLRYENGEINGEATLSRRQGSQEVFNFVNGVKEGPSEECQSDGSREERAYVEGVLQGLAVLYGANGDRLEFSYRDGRRFGAMTYFFADGSVERSFYDENGDQSGPTQFTWANDARREGHKVKGQWEGQAYYHFSEGPRKGKRDMETWKNGELVSSQKYFGEGESITIQNWEDLKKLENHAASTPSEQTENSSPDKDVFYDCISSDCV